MIEAGTLHVLMGMPRPGIPGGPQDHLPRLVAGLRAHGVQVHEEEYGNPYGAISMFRRISHVAATATRFRKALREGHYDIIQLNSAFDTKAVLRDLAVVLSLGRHGEKIVVKYHGSDEALLGTVNPVLQMITKKLMGRVAAVGVLSREEQRLFKEAGIRDGKVVVVKNVLDPSLYHPDPDFNQRHGFPEGVPVILFSARFIPDKGLIDVLRACAQVVKCGYRIRLVCAGDGPSRREAEKETRFLEIQDDVRFTGHLSEERMREYYANAAMLAFPTYHQEGFPMAVFQSVAAGLPVITTRIRASADYLSEPDNCLWVEPRNPAMLADRIMQLLRDGDLRRRMSVNNRMLAEQFTAAKVSEEYIALYEHVTGRC